MVVRTSSNRGSIVLWLFCIAFGIVMFLFLLPSLSGNISEEYVQTKATITSFNTKFAGTGETEYVPVVSFSDGEGNTYTADLDAYSAGMRIGDEIDIYYDPLNPTLARMVYSGARSIFIFAPLIFSVIGVIGLISRIVKKNGGGVTRRSDDMTDALIQDDYENDREEEFEARMENDGKNMIISEGGYGKAYEISTDKIGKMLPSKYTFKNYLNGKTKVLPVSPNMNFAQSAPVGFNNSMCFAISNLPIWMYLDNNYLRIEYDTQDLKANRYILSRHGEKLATIEISSLEFKTYNIKTNAKYMDSVAIAMLTIFRLGEGYSN